MEASGSSVDGVAIRAPELRELARHRGPVATIVLTTAGDVENASQLTQRRWRALREDLAARGAPAPALDAINPLVPDAHTAGGCLVAIAAADGSLLHREHAPDPPAADHAVYDNLAALAPLVRLRQAAPPYVLVIADRRGADIVTVARAAEPRETTVEGDDAPIRKVMPGGWSQRRYQQRAENTWDANARDNAAAVAQACDRIGAELVVVAGDVRARELLVRHLPDRYAARVTDIGGAARTGDGSRDDIEQETRRWVATVGARHTVEVLEKFREERGQHDRAADGVDATFAALNASQVDALLVHDDWSDDRRACIGRDPIPVARDAATLESLRVDGIESGRLTDVAIAAALGTGAGVCIVPRAGGPTDGLGAVLRWA